MFDICVNSEKVVGQCYFLTEPSDVLLIKCETTLLTQRYGSMLETRVKQKELRKHN